MDSESDLGTRERERDWRKTVGLTEHVLIERSDIKNLKNLRKENEWGIGETGQEKENEEINGLGTKQNIQGVQNASVHLMIAIQKITSNFQIVPRHSPDIY
jgi:hypothetical protein